MSLRISISEDRDNADLCIPDQDPVSISNHVKIHDDRDDTHDDRDDIHDDLDEIMKDPQLKRREIIRIWKNLIFIFIAFAAIFTTFNGASVLQSSLNSDQGLGTGTLAIIYGAQIISAMFLPTFVINFFGCKWTIMLAICGYVTYPLANFYPHWGTLVPSSICVGLCAAPLWAAKCTYLTTSAERYARLTKESTDAVVNRFFGVFFFFFQSTFIIGNLISSFVLSSGDAKNLKFPSCYNETFVQQYCGKGDCQKDFASSRLAFNSTECPVTSLEGGKVPDATIYTLMGIYTGTGICGALVTAFLVDNIRIRKRETRGPFDLFIATFKHMKDKRQLLLIPITMYSGLEQAFLVGDFTRSYITCPLAVNWVGFVLICYGACDAIFCFTFGRLEKHTGRWPLLTLAFLINIALIITFQTWIPYPNSVSLFFILPALWGIADAAWQTQLNAYYGVLFVANQEASFANYRLWESLGFVIAFAYQNFICVSIKLWVLLAVLLLGFTCYNLLEWNQRGERKSHEKSKLSPDSTASDGAHQKHGSFLKSPSSNVDKCTTAM